MSEVAEKIRQLIGDAESAIADLKIEGSSNLDSAIQFHSGKIIAFKEILAAVAELEQQIEAERARKRRNQKDAEKHFERAERLEQRLSEIRAQWNKLPQGIIEVGGITLQNLLRFKEWSDKIEKLLDGGEQP